MTRLHHAALALVAAACALALLAAPSPAIVPPSNCGTMTVKAKRYTIKADQLRCATARSHASRYGAVHRCCGQPLDRAVGP